MSEPESSRKVAISNIAWSGEANEPFLDLLVKEGAHGVELAASLIWDEPIDSTPAQRKEVRQMFDSRGLAITGLHALLFSRSDMQLLAEGQAGRNVIEYLKRTVDVCADLGGHCLVMGGSKNRLRGDMSVEDANKKGAEVLRELGDYAAERDCYFSLEALPPPVCDFIMNLKESEELVALTASEGLKGHFDSGAASVTEENNDDVHIIERLKKVAHVQVNDFELCQPGSKTPEQHQRWARLLNEAGYNGWVGIEMRRTGDPTETIPQALRFVKETYSI